MTDTDAGDLPTPSSTSEASAPADQPEPRPDPVAASDAPGTDAPATDDRGDGGEADGENKPRRRGSRGGRNRNRPRPEGAGDDNGSDDDVDDDADTGDQAPAARTAAPRAPRAPRSGSGDRQPELPDRHRENKPSAEAADAALVRKPQIGDSRPAPADEGADDAPAAADDGTSASSRRRRRRGGRGRGGSGGGAGAGGGGGGSGAQGGAKAGGGNQQRSGGNQRKGGGRPEVQPVTAITDDAPVDLDEKTLNKRRGKERKGRPVGRYLMAVHVKPEATQIAVLEGKALIEHYVSRPADDTLQIHGNIYLAKVQNVLPGMEAAFVDIGTPKNAVLYRGDTRYDPEDLDDKGANPRIEQILKARQTILCQVTKNPIGAKGARLTQEISLPGRFVVLVPNSTTYGISKRLPDNERKRLRQILDKAKPKGHGLIVRTAAEGISAEELARDVERLAQQWEQIEALAAKSQAPTLLYRDPDMSIRVIREEFNQDYRQVVIDDDRVFEQVRDYVRSISPALVERVERYDPAAHGGLPIYETLHVHEQLHKALDRKVWLPSGGSLIIERTEALTVIDVNTGKNVGKSSLEETVYRNNLEAAEEVARQLRLRDIGGIIVIDFIDMEIRKNRDDVISKFRQALARDKTRTQVFDISELGLVEMTRKRIGEGLLESLSSPCPHCDGRGMVFDEELTGHQIVRR
ncbi:Rne/Rng family ribonuclease [Aquihabitans sp. McL0605]|uniref:Rne/Rng family ribonuclease n=1 Tax=Aquihabitans sp. McL0605 TaxID=3415671 RepID=UPI003CF71CD2